MGRRHCRGRAPGQCHDVQGSRHRNPPIVPVPRSAVATARGFNRDAANPLAQTVPDEIAGDFLRAFGFGARFDQVRRVPPAAMELPNWARRAAGAATACAAASRPRRQTRDLGTALGDSRGSGSAAIGAAQVEGEYRGEHRLACRRPVDRA
jgi:hypothetical protein